MRPTAIRTPLGRGLTSTTGLRLGDRMPLHGNNGNRREGIMKKRRCRHWEEPFNSELVTGYVHRLHAQLLEATMWDAIDLRYRPTTPEGWQAMLLASASGNAPGVVSIALQHGASPTKRMNPAWVSVNATEVPVCIDGEPAYYWLSHNKQGQAGDVTIWTPVQAAVASGSCDCIRLVAEAGANLTEVLFWLAELELNIARIEAGLSLLETTPDPQLDRNLGRSWLARAQEWLARSTGRPDVAPDDWERYNTIHLRVGKLCSRIGLQQRLSTEALAHLL